MKIPRIILYSDYANSGCSFWRSHGPFLELYKQGEIDLIEGTYNDTWTTLRGCDIAFFQRPMSIDVKNQIFMCKDLGLKIWVDLDDYNYISPHHPVYNVWCEKYDESTFRKIMLLTDMVTVTTKGLQNHYLTYNNNVVIIPNAINDHFLRFNKTSENNIVLLRGGSHHLSDIWEYRNEITEVMKDNKEWELHVLGGEIQFLNSLPNYKFCGNYNIHQYFAYLLRVSPSVIILPLEDNELNKNKSNIGWQEATLCGAACLTPYWFKLGKYSLTYKDKKTFKGSFDKLIKDSELRKSLHDLSSLKVKSDYLLSKVNNKRLQIIKELIK